MSGVGMLSNIFKFFFNIIIIILSIIYINISSFSEDKKIQCFKKFTLAFYNYGLFYSAETKKGIDKDVAEELIKRSKCNIELFEMPRIRIWKSLENGKLDFATSGIQTPERDQFAYFAYYSQFKNFVISRKDANVSSWNDFLSHKTLKLGVIRGFKHGDSDKMVDLLQTENRVLDFAEEKTLYEELYNNHVQAVLGPIVNYSFYLKKDKSLVHKVKIEDWLPAQKLTKTGFIMSKKIFSKTEANKWAALIYEMNNDGTTMKIFRKYLSEKDAKSISLN
jgi:polar amino acid transport system substrate-binding protein